MKIFRKTFPVGTAPSDIQREVELQKAAAQVGFSPKVFSTDYMTFIEMEDLEEMCVADKYGEDIDGIPSFILEDIYKMLSDLYYIYNIHYIDVTPYNFIERDGRTWIIDFGHATRRRPGQNTNWYLIESLDAGKISYWNPDFK
jgi:tRNA A-37 threonylcarbamoyl transferase component Bud32